MPVISRRPSEQPTSWLPPAAAVPQPVPDRALAVEALHLISQLDDPTRVPASWSESAFAREVALVRAHLAPIRSRTGLAASYSREAFHTTYARPEPEEPPGAVRVAYAIRWLELGRGIAWPAWPAGPGSRPSAV